MKILIALDESAHSKQALQFVSRLRWPAGSRFIVASALQPAVSAATVDMGYLPGRLLEEQRREADEFVAAAESELRETGLATEARVEIGDPREVLVTLAESERVDLIVVGSHGRKGLAKLMLGSVSSHVVTHAPCSVLVVKHSCLSKTGGKP